MTVGFGPRLVANTQLAFKGVGPSWPSVSERFTVKAAWGVVLSPARMASLAIGKILAGRSPWICWYEAARSLVPPKGA